MSVYALYLSLIVTAGIGAIIGFIVALVKRNSASTSIGKSHLAKQVRLALYALGGIVFGVLLLPVASVILFYLDLGREYDFMFFAGVGVSLISVIWFLGASVIGMSKAFSGSPV